MAWRINTTSTNSMAPIMAKGRPEQHQQSQQKGIHFKLRHGNGMTTTGLASPGKNITYYPEIHTHCIIM